MSINQQVAAKAIADIGQVYERPDGSNDDGGGAITKMEAHWGMRWEPWCGMACSKWLRSVPGVTDVSHPSTWEIVRRAREKGWITTRPVPGCLIVWPRDGGRHVEMVIEVIDADTVATVGGNVDNRVQRKVREIADCSLVVSPELRNAESAPRNYYLEDPAVTPKLYGPWLLRESREKVIRRMSPVNQAAVRRIRMGAKYAFTLGRRTYGPWVDKESRDAARRILEARLGRTLRPYSLARPTTSTSAESLGKTT